MILRLTVIYSYVTALLIQTCHSLPDPQTRNFLENPTGYGMTQVQEIDVKCGRSGMSVAISFDGPFKGVIYSKGFFSDQNCNYVDKEKSYRNSYIFWIPSEGCGTAGNMNESVKYSDDPPDGKDMFFTNTIVIQNDPQIQEIWDSARTLRCSWQNTMKKSLKTDAIKVRGPRRVGVNFDVSSVNTLTGIESEGSVRSSSSSSSSSSSVLSGPVTGYISDTPQDRSLVIYLQDSSGSLDANVVSCYWRRSETGVETALIDAHGCLVRSDLMSEFEKVRGPNNIEADMQLFASLKNLELNADSEFSVSCQLEICLGNCLPACALGPAESKKTKRIRRQVPEKDGLPQGIVFVTKHRTRDSNPCFMGDTVAIATSALFVLVCFLGGLCAYLALRLDALTAALKARADYK